MDTSDIATYKCECGEQIGTVHGGTPCNNVTFGVKRGLNSAAWAKNSRPLLELCDATPPPPPCVSACSRHRRPVALPCGGDGDSLAHRPGQRARPPRALGTRVKAWPCGHGACQLTALPCPGNQPRSAASPAQAVSDIFASFPVPANPHFAVANDLVAYCDHSARGPRTAP